MFNTAFVLLKNTLPNNTQGNFNEVLNYPLSFGISYETQNPYGLTDNTGKQQYDRENILDFLGYIISIPILPI